MGREAGSVAHRVRMCVICWLTAPGTLTPALAPNVGGSLLSVVGRTSLNPANGTCTIGSLTVPFANWSGSPALRTIHCIVPSGAVNSSVPVTVSHDGGVAVTGWLTYFGTLQSQALALVLWGFATVFLNDRCGASRLSRLAGVLMQVCLHRGTGTGSTEEAIVEHMTPARDFLWGGTQVTVTGQHVGIAPPSPFRFVSWLRVRGRTCVRVSVPLSITVRLTDGASGSLPVGACPRASSSAETERP